MTASNVIAFRAPDPRPQMPILVSTIVDPNAKLRPGDLVSLAELRASLDRAKDRVNSSARVGRDA